MKSIKYLIVILAAVFSSCEIGVNNCTDGNGNRIMRELEVAGEIKGIQFKIAGELILRQSNTQRITIEGDENIVAIIEEQSSFRDSIYVIDDGNTCTDTDGLKMVVQLNSISYLEMLGSGDIKSENTLNTGDEFRVSLDGSGNIDLALKQNLIIQSHLIGSGDIQLEGATGLLISGLDGSGKIDLKMGEATRTTLVLDGSGEIKAEGSTNEHRVFLMGSGAIRADNYKSQDCLIDLSGSGDIEVFAEETLMVRISGSGDVCYKGNPNITLEVTGSGELTECN